MLEKIPAAVGRALASVRPGIEKTVYAHPDLAAVPEALSITSGAFADGGVIPARFTEDGAKVSPPLAFVGVPSNVASLALAVEDADSPTPAPFCHALVWGIAPETGGFQESALDAGAMPTTRSGAVTGKTSMLSTGWLPPDPPPGHGPHRYVFQLYALDVTPDLEEGAGRSAFVAALKGHVVAKGLLIGTYERG